MIITLDTGDDPTTGEDRVLFPLILAQVVLRRSCSRLALLVANLDRPAGKLAILLFQERYHHRQSAGLVAPRSLQVKKVNVCVASQGSICVIAIIIPTRRKSMNAHTRRGVGTLVVDAAIIPALDAPQNLHRRMKALTSSWTTALVRGM